MKKLVLCAVLFFASEACGMTEFEKIITSTYGQHGKVWLAQLPQLVDKLATQWGLSDLELASTPLYNYVLKGWRGQQPIILKLGLHPDEPRQEVQALRAFAGSSVPRVLEFDQVSQAFLLERVLPGTTLESYFPERDEEATQIFCDVVKGLARVTELQVAGFDCISREFEEFNEGCEAIPPYYINKALKLGKLLLETAEKPLVLCHSDLNFGNILRSGERWIAIDPLPVLAEPALHAIHFIWNPYILLAQQPDFPEIVKRRIVTIAEQLQINQERIERWCFVRAIISWAWFVKGKRDTTELEMLVKWIDPLTPDDLDTPSPLFL